jgi:hypothetical protein
MAINIKWALLFLLFLVVLVLDVLILDPLPFLDEIALGIGAYLTGREVT